MKEMIESFRAEVERTEAAHLRFITMRTVEARNLLDMLEQTSRAQRTDEGECKSAAAPAAGQAGLAKELHTKFVAIITGATSLGENRVYDLANALVKEAAPVAASSRDMLIAEAVRNECLSAAHDADPKHEIRRIDLAAIVSKVSAPVAADTEQATDDDLLDVVRTFCSIAARMRDLTPQQLAHYPAPTAEGSPLLAAARAACVARGYTEDGLAVEGVTYPAFSSDEADELRAHGVEPEKLVKIGSLATPADAGAGLNDCDAAFDAWYAAQSHQLTNEQLCRLIWQRGWQACASMSTSPAPVTATDLLNELHRLFRTREWTDREGDWDDALVAVCEEIAKRIQVARGAVSAAPVTAEPARSIDTPEFCDLITELHAAHEEVSAEDSKKAWAALIAHIDRHIATHSASADRDAIREWAATVCESERVTDNADDRINAAYNAGCDDCAKAIRALKSMERAAGAKGEQQ